MEMLWRRRVALFCFGFVFAGFVSVFLTALQIVAGTALGALLLALTFLPPLRRGLNGRVPARFIPLFRLVLCAAVAAGCFFGVYQGYTLRRPVDLYDGVTAEVTAEILEKQYATAYTAAYTAEVETAEGILLRVLLTTEDTSLTAGDTIRSAVRFSVLPEYSGTFPQRRYYASMGISLCAEADDITYIGQTDTSLSHLFTQLRDSLTGMLRADLGRADSSLVNALFLGDRQDLSDTLNRDFKRLGVAHLLAISGMHFTVLLTGLDRLLSPFIPGKKKRALLLAVADIGYMLLCGLSESVVRAGLMMLLAYAAMFFGRKSDMPTALGVSAFLITLFSPASVYSAGLQLSVTSVLALCAFAHIVKHLRGETPLTKKQRLVRQMAEGFLLPVVVQIVLMPLLCLYFGEFSLITPLATVLLTPLTELLLLVAPLYLALRIVPPVAAVLGTVIGLLTKATAGIAAALSSLRGISISLAYPFVPIWAAVLSASILTAPLQKDRRALRRHFGGALGLFVLFFVVIIGTQMLTADEVHIHSVAQGKNDAVILMTAGDTMLIDVSDGAFGALSGAYATAAEAGAVELEALYLTHLHNRHIQSVDRLSDTVYVRSLLLPTPKTEAERIVYDAICSCMQQKHIPVYAYTGGDVISWGDNVEIYTQSRVYLSRSTHPVIAFALYANGTVLSYLGTSAEEVDAFTDPSDADILIFGAHGPIRKAAVSLTLSPHLHTVVMRTDMQSAPLGLSADTNIYTGKETVFFRLKP